MLPLFPGNAQRLLAEGGVVWAGVASLPPRGLLQAPLTLGCGPHSPPLGSSLLSQTTGQEGSFFLFILFHFISNILQNRGKPERVGDVNNDYTSLQITLGFREDFFYWLFFKKLKHGFPNWLA